MTNFNDEMPSQETELCFAAAVLTLNFLVLAVMSGIVWILYLLLMQPSVFEASAREFQLL